MSRSFYSREIKVGDLLLGGMNRVLIQTMTNTKTSDIKATVNQIEKVVREGSEIVRVAVPSLNDAKSLKEIKKRLRELGIKVPLVADVHYSPEIAETSARFVEKVRVNPGNFVFDSLRMHYTEKEFNLMKEEMFDKVQPLLRVCAKYGTALRVGVNYGSLSNRILYRYGNTAKGMVASAMEFIDILLASGFERFTLSLKASDVKVMQEANVLLVEEMIKNDVYFPLHLGVTEAGAGDYARVKSAAGIGALLKMGIGDTVRVSLTENPENEIPVAKKIIGFSFNSKITSLQELKNINFHNVVVPKNISENTGHSKAVVISSGFSKKADLIAFENKIYDKNKTIELSRSGLRISKIISEIESYEDFLVESSVNYAYDFLKNKANAIFLVNKNFTNDKLSDLSMEILQAVGLRYSKAEFVACPSCGRATFNVEKELNKLQKRLSNFKGMKIAVMGCSVNGPGEMADADFGYVGTGKEKVTIYKAGEVYKKNIPEDAACEELIKIITRTLNE
jgi:(E)-4-hydroxy-3-methylbut-2-enyl-diphosphate synthase